VTPPPEELSMRADDGSRGEGPTDYTQRYRALRAAGRERDVALGILRRAGARFIQCMKAVYEVDGLPVGECKMVVHRSLAWSDEFAAREVFWDEVIRLLEGEANAKHPPSDAVMRQTRR
jgi:hypothetical protein